MLRIYRRHRSSCSHSSERYRRCSCPILRGGHARRRDDPARARSDQLGSRLKKLRTARFKGVVDAPSFIRAGVKRIVYRREDLDVWLSRHIERVGPKRS